MAEVKTTCREELLAKLREDPVWDVVVIGGGATGAGIAVDAASRGLKTVVLEAQDFSSGTSSRSTKLIHGGVRYMKNPRDWGLVREALKERRILIKNAPPLVHSKPFILPCYKKGEREFYTIGLGISSAMPYGGYNIGHTSRLSRGDTLMRLPGVKPEGLMGGVQFFDGQFDDARLDVALIRTAYEHGAVPLNYMPVVGVTREGGMIRSVTAKDKETGEEFVIRTKMVFNAAGAWGDPLRRRIRMPPRSCASPAARTSCSTSPSCPATPACSSRRPATAACSSPFPGTACSSSARPTWNRRKPTSIRR